MQAVEDRQGLLARGRRAGDRTSCRRACTLAATAEQLRAEFAEAEHITKDTLASLLRRASPGRRRQGRGPVSIGGRSTTSTRSSTERSRTPSDGAASPGTQPTRPTRHTAARSPTASTRGTRRRCAPFLDASPSADDRLHALVGAARHHRHAARRSARPAMVRPRPRCRLGSASCRRSSRRAAR